MLSNLLLLSAVTAFYAWPPHQFDCHDGDSTDACCPGDAYIHWLYRVLPSREFRFLRSSKFKSYHALIGDLIEDEGVLYREVYFNCYYSNPINEVEQRAAKVPSKRLLMYCRSPRYAVSVQEQGLLVAVPQLTDEGTLSPEPLMVHRTDTKVVCQAKDRSGYKNVKNAKKLLNELEKRYDNMKGNDKDEINEIREQRHDVADYLRDNGASGRQRAVDAEGHGMFKIECRDAWMPVYPGSFELVAHTHNKVPV